ncbi:hypothetical protein ACNHUS_34870 [Actinomycetes bacterium M1A6_2h]
MASTSVSGAPLWRPFALVYARFQGSRTWHPDLAGFYERRFEAYVALLGLELPDLSERESDRSLSLFEHGFHRLGVKYGQYLSPYDGIIAAPPLLITVVRKFDPLFRELIAKEKELILDAMAETADLLWGSPRRTVTDDDLVPYGVDAAREPNEYYYM